MFRIDNTFPHCEKVLLLKQRYPRIFHQCITMWVFGGCHADLNGTDGVLSRGLESGLSVPMKTASRCAQALLDVGLWELDDKGFKYHDWDHWNETKAEKQQRKEKNRERKQRQRDRGGHVNVTRDNHDPPRALTNTSTINQLTPLTPLSKKTEWLLVIKTIVEVTGQVLEPHYHRQAAESILRTATQLNGQDPEKIVRAAVTAWWADDWVQQEQPNPTHLAKNFAKYANSSPQASGSYMDHLIQLAEKDLETERSHGDPKDIAKAEARYQKLKTQKQQLEGAA